jgi:hypothetical protein
MWVDNDVPNWFLTLNNFYWSPFSKWPPQYHKNSTIMMSRIECWIFSILWLAFWKWWPVEIFQCQESIRGIIICPHMKWRWNRTMLPDIEKFLPIAIFKMAASIPLKFNIVRFQRHFICGQIMMPRIDSWHWKIINSGHHYLPTFQIVMICG